MPEQPTSSLADRVAVVTGAAGGLGQATIELFLRLGASVVAEDVDAAVYQLAADRVAPIQGDVRVAATAVAATQLALDRFGALDILVNNAGVIVTKDILETTDAEWDEVMAVNVRGPFHHIRAVLPEMLRRKRGVIVNVTSISGVVGLPKQAVYCASKGALVQLTRQVAVEYAGRGIRVNSVAPGAVDTPFLERYLSEQPDRTAAEAEIRAAHPLGRYAPPAEIASAIAYLASDASSFLTGTILMADGGYTAR